MIEDVRALVVSGALTPLQGVVLNLTLRFAVVALNAGTLQVALNFLQAFDNTVDLYVVAGALSPAEGQLLIDRAEDVIGFLGN